VMG
jgi:hypothetical protein